MINRRAFLTTLVMSSMTGLFYPRLLNAQLEDDYEDTEDDDYHGCFLSSGEFEELGIDSTTLRDAENMMSETDEFDDATDDISSLQTDFHKNTGNKLLDRAIGKSLTHMSDFFSVYPGFGFFNDKNPNAYATAEIVVPDTKGTIVFGYNLLKKQLEKAPSGVSIMGILAHEFAHIVQFNHKQQISSLRLNQTTSRLIELHADFLAGFYTGKRKLVNKRMRTDDLGDAFLAIGDSNTTHADHHGTPEERVFALTEGFKLGKNQSQNYSVEYAIKKGVQVVHKI